MRLLEFQEADVLSAYRFDRTLEGPLRTIYTFFYTLLIRTLFDLPVKDVNFSFKLFRRSLLDSNLFTSVRLRPAAELDEEGQLAYTAALVPFLALTGYVLETAGLIGFFAEMARSPSTALAMLDLTLSLSLILVWMHGDSRTATPFLPYVAITLAIGVAGPLLYLIHRYRVYFARLRGLRLAARCAC